MRRPSSLLVLLPSLRISGGVAETLKLARELKTSGVEIHVVSFWRATHQLNTSDLSVTYLLDSPPRRGSALLELPLLAVRFISFAHQWRRSQPGHTAFLLTHFTTFLFVWLLPWVPRVCFNQDQEWLMVQGWKRGLLKRVILFTSRRSVVVTSNRYITTQFEKYGVRVFREASIWADSKWLAPEVFSSRSVNVTMLLRMSPFKRLDLHLALLQLLKADPSLFVAVVTPDEAIAQMVKESASTVMLRPTDADLKNLFADTRLFILLSDVEGFGLPPLEAMGNGAVPLCRDSGGVRNYMRDGLESLLIPATESVEEIRDRVLRLLAGEGIPAPEEMRAIFARGLSLSRETRAETIRHVSALLQGEA
jgi:glycosyltransferase involved in cell wall biosynthesis